MKKFITIKFPIFILYSGLLVFAFGKSYFSTSANTQTSISLQNSVVAEGNDFATRELGMPWDMKSDPYPDFITALKNVNRSTFKVENGVWELTATNADVKFWLHWSGIENTQDILKMGENYPINSSKYKLLSFYMCADSSSRANVSWFYTGSPWSNYGVSRYLQFDAGCKLHTMNLSTFDTFQGSWQNNPIGLRLDPVSDLTTFQIDWVRLTSIDTNNYLPISWSNLDPNATHHFFLSKSGCDVDGIPIGTVSGNSSGVF